MPFALDVSQNCISTTFTGQALATTVPSKINTTVRLADPGVSQEVQEAIQTDLAPTAAVSVLEKANDPAEPGTPALKCMGVGLTEDGSEGSLRLQFIFDNGTVLPIDVPRDACQALNRALSKEFAAR